MEALGYSLTWQTQCFIQGGCGQQGLFAHTNGYGDFVLFDALGPPWPVHDCYIRRFELSGDSDILDVRGSRTVEVSSHPNRSWDVVRPVDADLERHRTGINIIGTITNIHPKFVGGSEQFRDLPNKQKADIKKVLGTRRSFIVVVTGDGYEYGVFTDLQKFPARFRDTVAAKLKPVRLLNQDVFVATQLRVFRFDGQ